MTQRPSHLDGLQEIAGRSVVLDVDGRRLHHLDYGGDGPTLVIAPGITSPAITWDFVAAAIADLAHVIVCDIRGRGLSDAPAAGYSLDDYAADLLGVADGVGAERPILLGHSMGARIVAAFAAAHPRRVAHVIALDPPMSGPGRPYPMPLAVFRAQLAEARAGTTADDVAVHYPRWPRRELELRARWLETCSEAAVAESHESFERELFPPLWRAVEAPATLIYGTESPVVLASDIPTLAAANPAATLLGVDAAGHMIPWDQPDLTIALLRALIHPLALTEAGHGASAPERIST